MTLYLESKHQNPGKVRRAVCPALENERQRIPKKGVLDTHRRLELSRPEEGFDELSSVTINDVKDFFIQELGSISCLVLLIILVLPNLSERWAIQRIAGR